MKSIGLRLRAPWLACGFSCLALNAFAQEAARDSETMDEVVVSARRSEEKLLDVPLAISVLTARDIEARDVRNLDDVAAATPGLQFSNLIGEFLPVPVIRGQAPVSIFGENNAAVFVDGAYVAGREGLNFAQLDLERIEVLKGPQTAAYGRNAFSGAINYVTARPSSELKGKVELVGGSDGRKEALGVISGPLLGETLTGRLAVMKDSFDGTYDNQVAGGPDIGGYEFETAQASLFWRPVDSFDALLSIYASNDQIASSAITPAVANCENRNVVDPAQSSRLQNFCGELPTINADSLFVPEQAIGEDRDLFRTNLNLAWRVGGGTLSSISGYTSLQQSYFLDAGRGRAGGETFAYVRQPVIPIPGVNPGFVGTFDSPLINMGPGDETREFSEELRFTSSADEPLRFSVGTYYYTTRAEARGSGVVATGELPGDFYAFCPCFAFGMAGRQAAIPGFGDAVFLPWFQNPNGDTISDVVARDEIKAWSLFGYVEYDFTDRWNARIEGRWVDEEKTLIDPRADTSVSDSWSFPTWRATLKWEPTDRVTIYSAISEARKSGGFDNANVAFQSNPSQTVLVETTFDEEKNLSFELGVKAMLAGGRIELNADAYTIKWTDIVIPQVLAEIDGQALVQPTGFDINAGDASVHGVEANIRAHVGDAWQFDLGAAWSDAQYDDVSLETFRLFPSYAPDGDISGNQILRHSEWQAAASGSYTREFGDWTFSGRADLAYRGKQFADASNQAIVPENTFLNAAFTLARGDVSLTLWGRNLLHEDAPTGAYREVLFSNYSPNAPIGGAGSFFPFSYNVNHPRLTTWGLTARWKF
jgi:iron complex outermembrane recepter protein